MAASHLPSGNSLPRALYTVEGGLPPSVPGPAPLTCATSCMRSHKITAFFCPDGPMAPYVAQEKVQIQKYQAFKAHKAWHSLSRFYLHSSYSSLTCLPSTHTPVPHTLQDLGDLGISPQTPCPQPFPGGRFPREAFRSVSASSPVSHCSRYLSEMTFITY